MAYICKFIFWFALLSLLTGCSGKQESKYVVDFIPVEDREQNTYKLWGSDGYTFKASFDDVPSPVINGFFSKWENDVCTLCKIQGDGYLPVYSDSSLLVVGVSCDGLIPICRDAMPIEVINDTGNKIFTLDEINGVEVECCYSYSCGRMRVKLKDNTYCYIDKDGRLLFDSFYQWCSDFKGGYAVVSIDDDTYALIDQLGEELFSFYSKYIDDIVFSPEHEKLSTMDRDKRIIIYDFDGHQVGVYPSKVEEVADLLADCFIFENEDYGFGLMSYSGKELIRAKYEELVACGDYFLARHEDDEEEIRLLDISGTVLKTIDGEKIYSFKHEGFDFPNIIKRVDGEFYIVDDLGKVVGQGAMNIDFEEDNVLLLNYVPNLYFPKEKIMDEVMSLCGYGKGLPKGENAFFYKNNAYCHPREVKFIKDTEDKSVYNGKKNATKIVAKGVSYEVSLSTQFDEPIAKNGVLTATAWLTDMFVTVKNITAFTNSAFYDECREKLLSLGCTPWASYDKGHILLSTDKKHLIVFERTPNRWFYIIFLQNTQNNRDYWMNLLSKNNS